MSALKDSVLIVDDDVDILEGLEDWFLSQDYDVLTAVNGEDGLKYLRTKQINLVMLDITLPDISGLSVLQKIKEEGIETTVIIGTAWGSVDRAVEAMQNGALDFIEKPYETSRLQIVVEKARERDRLRREIAFFRSESEQADSSKTFIGDSAAMTQIKQMANRVAKSNASVLILGATGTGKEILAGEIHRMSNRADLPMMKINCVALPESMLESELFGHEKGAFTDAKEMRKGKFEVAHGSTIMLDEIGATSLSFQTKILRVLQEGEIQRLGSSGRVINVDVRIIAATNRDLKAAIADGDFLEDLYYRLNVVDITMPSLRDHKEDIPALAVHFLKKYVVRENRPDLSIADATMAYLCAYDWPGNIRELENVIERVVVMCPSDEILPADLPSDITGRSSSPPSAGGGQTIEEQIGQMVEVNNIENPIHIINALTTTAIVAALKQTNSNKSKAARLLGYPPSQRKQIDRLIDSLNIPIPPKQ